MTIDDEKLLAYLDGEASPEEAETIARALENDPDLKARLEAQKRLKAQLADHYAPVANEPVPDRFTALLGAGSDDDETMPAGELVELAEARRERRARRPGWGEWRWPQLGAIAASLAIGMIAGPTIFDGPDNSTATLGRDFVLAADDPLATALDTQLASTQASDAPIRIGITFVDQRGNYCRTFDGPELEGVACREEGSWQLALAAARTGTGADPQFRQAASGDRIILDYAQSIIAGAPIDAEEEQQARANDWAR